MEPEEQTPSLIILDWVWERKVGGMDKILFFLVSVGLE
jgi:hypothetical protein